LAAEKIARGDDPLPSPKKDRYLRDTPPCVSALDSLGRTQRSAASANRRRFRTDIRAPSAFDAFKGRADAIYVGSDPLLFTHRLRINTLALDAGLPTIYGFREGAETGGLISYGPSYPSLFRRAADYVDKILRGTKPSELPVEQPTKFELVVNQRAAKAIGLTVPDKLLALADEVIE
jgi:ABC-type uncharacterized transport system substrate-binding protein